MLVLLVGMLLTGLSSLVMAQEGTKAGKAHTTRIEKALAGITLSAEEKAKVDPVLAEYKEKAKTAEISEQKPLSQEYAAKISALLGEENKAKFEAAVKAKGHGMKEGGAAK